MKILFILPRWEKFLESRPELGDLAYARQLDSFRVAPLGIPAVAACTPPEFELSFRDDFTEPDEGGEAADLVAISAFTPSATRAYEIADAYRARGVPVVLGGLHPTLLPEEAGEHADAVVIGEAEGVWPRVLEDASRNDLKPFYRSDTPVDLGTLAHPKRDLVREKGLDRICVVQTGRGCPRSCPTCALPAAAGRTVRRRPVKAVLEEIEELVEPSFYLSEESLLFGDASNRAWTEELLQGMAGFRKPFFIATYPFLLRGIDAGFLDKLEKAGNRQFYVVFGVDDAGPDALWGHLDEVKRVLDAVRNAGISVMGSFALGGDEDGPGCFEQVRTLFHDLEINLAEFFLLTPYPGTPLFDRFEREGRLLTRSWKLYNGAHPVFRPQQMTPDQLVEGFIGLWREFYGGMTRYSSAKRFVRGFGSKLIRLQNPEKGAEGRTGKSEL